MSEIELINSFEGASIGDHNIINQKIFANLKEEPSVNKDGLIHDYNWHFVFGLKNNSHSPKEIEIFINCDNSNGLDHKANILGQHSLDSDFFPLNNIKAFTDTQKKYSMKLTLSKPNTFYLSNTYFRSMSLINAIFGKLSKDQQCKREVYGKSVEGRDLIAYIFSDPENQNNKPSFVVTSGFHPMEADTFATEAFMKSFASDEGRNLLRHFTYIIIPAVNPDGFVHGYNGCNAKGINLYWDFKQKDKINAPEAYYLWQFLLKVKPSIYVDFHSYTFQLHRKKASPYIKPLFFYSGEEVKNIVESINKELISLHDGYYLSGDLTYTPSALPYKLTNKFNTITYAKYHLHIMDGKEKYMNTAVNVAQKVSQVLISNNFTDKNKILMHPYGQVRGDLKDIIKRKLQVLWIFKIKVLIKKILHKI